MKKILYILIINLIFFNLSGQESKTDKYGALPENYGIIEKPKNQSYISPQYVKNLYRGFTGAKIPKTAYEEHILRKMLHTRLTKKELLIFIKKEKLNQPLTFFEQITYLKAKYKINRRQKILYKFALDTSKFASKTAQNLTPAEIQVLKKAQDSTQTLTKIEQKTLKRALKKQKRLKKLQQKYTLTPEDKLLLQKAKTDTVKLTLKEKIKLYKIHQKQKRIEQRKLQKMAKGGDWTPKPVTKTKTPLFNLNFSSKKRPSSYVRKIRRLQQRYKLSEDEINALNIVKSQSATKKDIILAKRARKKQWRYQTKVEKLKHKYFLKLQTKEQRKLLRKQARKEKIRRFKTVLRKSYMKLKTKIRDMF